MPPNICRLFVGKCKSFVIFKMQRALEVPSLNPCDFNTVLLQIPISLQNGICISLLQISRGVGIEIPTSLSVAMVTTKIVYVIG